MEARYPGAAEAVDDELEQLIARIRARGVRLTLPKPEPEAVAAFLDRTENEEAVGSEELEGHERMWRAIDEEMRSIDRQTRAAVTIQTDTCGMLHANGVQVRSQEHTS